MSFREIINSGNVLVREMELEQGAATEWHFHSEVSDYFVCLRGMIRVETRSPDRQQLLAPGDQAEVGAHQVHRVLNVAAGEAKYLLVQGVGAYDFCRPEKPLIPDP